MLPIGDTDGPSGSPTFQDVMAAARAAEDGGLDSVWLADHFLYRAQDGREFGLHEAWTLLSGIAAVTNRVQLGTLVLCTSFRNPVLTAKMAATLDVVSNGRLVLGLGCGWHEPEYSAMGLPFAERVSEFAESIEIISRLLRGERLSHAGRHHRLTDAVLAPPPIRHIPILVAAKKPRMLRLAAQWADAWNTAWYGRPRWPKSAGRSPRSSGPWASMFETPRRPPYPSHRRTLSAATSTTSSASSTPTRRWALTTSSSGSSR